MHSDSFTHTNWSTHFCDARSQSPISIMETPKKIWFRLVSPEQTSLTQVPLQDVHNVLDLKGAIKHVKLVDLKSSRRQARSQGKEGQRQ